MAGLEFAGQGTGTASLEISGKFNPPTRPMALDIKGRMRDLELPPLSPYAIKYAGHGIERASSAWTSHQVQPDGRLLAANKLVPAIDLWRPGRRCASQPAYAAGHGPGPDGNGVIDVDLPISGSAQRPGVCPGARDFQIIGNLVLKAFSGTFALRSRTPWAAVRTGDRAVRARQQRIGHAGTRTVGQGGTGFHCPACETVAGMATGCGTARAAARAAQQAVLAQKRRAAVRAGQAPDAVRGCQHG